MRRSAKIRKGTTIDSSSSSNNNNENKSINVFINKNLMNIIKIIGIIMTIIFAMIMWSRSNVIIQDLVNVDHNILKNVIFGDKPYLFYCNKDNNYHTSSSSSSNIPISFTELNKIKGSSMGFAILNCSQILPSGKNLYDRFKLKQDIKPVIFGTAPWIKPALQVTPTYLKDMISLRKFVDINMSPKPIDVINDKDFNKYCEFHKNYVYDDKLITDTCIIILRGHRYAKVHTDYEKNLILEYPKLNIIAINAKKKRLSFEKQHQDMQYIDYQDFAMKVYAIRNQTHFMPMVNPITWDYLTTFVSHAIGTPLYDYTSASSIDYSSSNSHDDNDNNHSHNNGGVIHLLKPSQMVKSSGNKSDKSSKKKKPTSSSGSSSSGGSRSTGSSSGSNAEGNKGPSTGSAPKRASSFHTDEYDESSSSTSSAPSSSSAPSTPILTEEEMLANQIALEQERIRKERLRREEMERQAKEHLFTEVTDDEEENSDGDGNDGDGSSSSNDEDQSDDDEDDSDANDGESESIEL